MTVAESLCWPSTVGDIFTRVDDLFKIKDRSRISEILSPTSQKCHQHKSPPTSITNINVVDFNKRIFSVKFPPIQTTAPLEAQKFHSFQMFLTVTYNENN